jgi:hypothetical protein
MATPEEQQHLQQQQERLHQAVNTLFPAFEHYVQRQTELNSIQAEYITETRTSEKEKRTERFINNVRTWANEESQHVPCCDGSSAKSVREWIRNIRAASKRVPEQEQSRNYMIKLICKTARGDLFEEIDSIMNKGDRDRIEWKKIVEDILEAFLGPDEQDALRDELKKIKQGAREEIPEFNRRYTKAAALAYPSMSEEEKRNVTKLYMVALRAGRIQDRLFDKDPRLETLEEATEAAYSEWARARFRERALHSRPEPEPMEVDVVTIREEVARQEKEIRELRKQIEQQAVKSSIPSPSSCLFCKEEGHWKNECPKRKSYWAKRGETPRPLTVEERSQSAKN